MAQSTRVNSWRRSPNPFLCTARHVGCWLLTAVLTVAGLTLADCSSPAHEPRNGGNLRVALSEWPSTFNPLSVDAKDEYINMAKASYPRAFVIQADGSLKLNTDYFSDVQSVGTDPQVVTYTINPKAVWTDGTSVTWSDIDQQVHALSGIDTAFAVVDTAGYSEVDSVRRGVDDRQAVVTFKHPYAAWQGMFAGDRMLLPSSVTATAAAFSGQRDGPGASAGPFTAHVDRQAQQIVLTHNPRWWGAPPRLDSLTYRVIHADNRMKALQHHDVDVVQLTANDGDASKFSWNYELAEARLLGDITVRSAPFYKSQILVFNGGPGAVFADRPLRAAVSLGVDRETFASIFLRGVVDNPRPLNNYIFVDGQPGYHDNAPQITYDPAEARRELDDLGWRLNGDVREKDGQKLVVRYPVSGDLVGGPPQVISDQLAQIGVKVNIETGATESTFGAGDFDISLVSLWGDIFEPLRQLNEVYGTKGRWNFGKVGSAEIDRAITDALRQPDRKTAEEKANDVDNLLWTEMPGLPIFQVPNVYAVSDDVANYLGSGLADVDFLSIRFIR